MRRRDRYRFAGAVSGASKTAGGGSHSARRRIETAGQNQPRDAGAARRSNGKPGGSSPPVGKRTPIPVYFRASRRRAGACFAGGPFHPGKREALPDHWLLARGVGGEELRRHYTPRRYGSGLGERQSTSAQ